MKAKATKDFQVNPYGKVITVQKGQLLDVLLDEDRSDEDGEIQLNGEYLCDKQSPFAREHFQMIPELELVELPEKPKPDRFERLQNIPLTKTKQGLSVNMTYDDYTWLMGQAQKAKEQEDWLNKIAEIDQDAFTATDAAYWALIALGRV